MLKSCVHKNIKEIISDSFEGCTSLNLNIPEHVKIIDEDNPFD